MDEFDKLMTEFDEWAEDAKAKIKALRQIDPTRLNAFLRIVAELIQIKHEYANKLPHLRTVAEDNIVRLAYSKGGEAIHRGFYCPSPVLDLIVGGLKRGRLYKKKIPQLGEYSYEYGFDLNGKLLRVKHAHEFGFDEEYLVYIGDVEYGLQFNYVGGMDAVSRCTYENGKLMKYEQCHCGGLEKLTDLFCEEYWYQNGLISEVNYFYNIVPRLESYEEDRLIIEHDEAGNIIRITSNKLIDGELKTTFVYHIKPPKK